MISIKRLEEVPLKEALEVWNQGFSDYFVPIKMTLEMFTYRLGFEELSPRLSVVAYIEDRPVGILLSGVRNVNGKRIAWNGGTSVHPEYRRHGVGKELVEASLTIYREEGVEIATLEAFQQNDQAIALYKQKGYELVDILSHYERKEAINPFSAPINHTYQIKRETPMAVLHSSFVQEIIPWQSQVASLRRDGEALILMDVETDIGYILYKRFYNEKGELVGIGLFQFEVDPKRTDIEQIIHYGLHHLFEVKQPTRLFTFNFRNSNTVVIDLLKKADFQINHEQVFMIHEISPTSNEVFL